MSNFNWQSGEKGHLSVKGGNIEYLCLGPSPQDQPTIVLLHEGLGSISTWKDFPSQLQKKTGLGVFVYSRFGYGSSDPVKLPRPVDYMTQEALVVLREILYSINVRQTILIGHSDGATIAAIYAGSTEDYRVRGIGLIAPHFFCEEVSITGIQNAKNAYENGDLKAKLAKHHNNPDNAFYGWNNAWLDPAFKAFNVSEVIDYFRIPVLAVQGETDQYGTMAQIEEIESRIYSPLDIELIRECGHSPHLEKPGETISIVSEFIERLVRIEREVVKIA